MVKTVYLVDGTDLFRLGCRTLLERDPNLAVVGEASGSTNAYQDISARPPDLVVLDLCLRQGCGLRLMERLRIEKPLIRLLVLTNLCREVYGNHALRAGADAYLSKAASRSRLLRAVWGVIRRGHLDSLSFLGDGERLSAVRRSDPGKLLTPRQLQIFLQIGQGRGREEIARDLCISVKTVESHCDHIRERLGLPDGRALLRRAILAAHQEPVASPVT